MADPNDIAPLEVRPDTGPAPVPAAKNSVGRVLLWVLAVVVFAGAAYAGVVGWQWLNRVRTAERAVSEAAALLEGAEDDLLAVDEAVQMDISSAVATQAVAAAERADEVHADVKKASDTLAAVMDDVPEDQFPLARALKESADARVEMMEIAPMILEADAQAATAISYADQAVLEIKGAEDLSAQAVVEFNNHTADSVRASDNLSLQAEAKLGVAASLLTSATASFPGADFSAFGNYVAAKVALIGLAKEIDALWLAGDVAGSNTKLDAYNQKDAEIVAMAQALPASVRDPIANAYAAATTEASAAYFAARERATAAGDRVGELRNNGGSSE